MNNEQELKKKRNSGKIIVNLLKKYPVIWFLSLLLIPIGVVIIAYNQLIYIGYVPQVEKAETPYIPVQSTISTFSDPSNPLPLWLIIAVIFCCSSGSFVIFYLLQNSKESTRTSQRHHHSQKMPSRKRYQSTNSKNLLIISPPEKIYPLNTNTAFIRDRQDSRFL
ncbi:hypothetical protein [Dolichospermum compactum]|nr:hypothetical protein [Dolichospermum compactum]